MKTGTQMALFDAPAQEAKSPVRVLEERLAQWERVQICRQRKCKAVFAVHWLWTGEPALCPACSAAAFREVYPNGWKQSDPEALPSSAPHAQ